MSRELSANNETGIRQPVTRPIWLVEMLYSTPIRLSSREEIEYDGQVYKPANMEVAYDPVTSTVKFFDDELQYSPLFAAEGSGQAAKLYAAWGEPPFAVADVDLRLEGETGTSNLDDFITVQLLAVGPGFAPRYRATAELGFNHLPAEGTELQTRAGTFVLRRDD